MTQPDADSTETRLQQLTDRFDGFAEETREFMEETRRNQKSNEQRFDEITNITKELRDDVARLKGRDYERYVSHTLLSPVSRRLGLRRPRLVHSVAYGTSDELIIRLEDPMEQQDLLEVALADAIVRGTYEGEPAYAVVEISLTVGNRDITRAADRAAILENATGVKTFPVVIGEHIPAHQEARANDMNVAVIQIAE